MTLNYKQGDLLECTKEKEFRIVHSGNNRGKMASGVAAAILNKFPQVKEDYLKAYSTYWVASTRWLGEVVISVTSYQGNIGYIYTIIGQDGYGYDGKKYVDYDALRRGFLSIKARVIQENPKATLSMPKIGAGLGGGDWLVISTIIKDVFKDTEFTINIYEL